MKIPKPPKQRNEEDFDTMVDIGARLRREAKRKEVEAQQEQLREEITDDEEE